MRFSENMKTAIQKIGKISVLIILLLIPLITTIVIIKMYKVNKLYATDVYTQPPVDPPCSSSLCYASDPDNPANGCANGAATCSGTVGGVDVTWYRDANGNYWYSPRSDNDNNNDSWDPPAPPQPPVITPVTTPTPGVGMVQVYALNAPISNLQTCDQLQLVKTCIDTPGGAGCSAITGSIDYLDGTQLYLNGAYATTQTDHTGVRYTNVLSNVTHTITASHLSGNYSPYIICNISTLNPQNLVWQVGSSFYLYPDDTTTVYVGLGTILPWFSIKGGGSTYGDTVISLLPMMTTPNLLYDTTTPTSPGILSTSTGYDMAESLAYLGTYNISSINWNTDNGMTVKNWYTFFKARLSQGTTLSYTGSGGKPDPVAGTAVYATTGALTINTPWNIGTDEKIIVLVEGSLDIRSTINITGKGFIQFVVRDNISVNPTVGTAWNSETPLVEGVYVAGATFSTGTSIVAATERFVGKGMFIANKISLGRNLVTAGANKTNSADLFLYNPDFLVTAPALLQDMNLEWQEVAP